MGQYRANDLFGERNLSPGLCRSDLWHDVDIVSLVPATVQEHVYSWRTVNALDDASLDIGGTPSTEAGVFNFLIDDAKSRDEDPYRPYDTGHEFVSWKSSVEQYPTEILAGSYELGHYYRYQGGTIPSSRYEPKPLFPPYESQQDEAYRLGRLAVSKTAPTHPVSTFGTGAGEVLHDGLPEPPDTDWLRERVKFFRGLGKAYLNVEFGWLPFISDLQSTFSAYVNRHKYLFQLERDSGKGVRRAFRFRPEVSTSVLYSGANRLLSPVDIHGNDIFGGVWDTEGEGNRLIRSSGDYQLTSRTEYSAWFKGEFTYFIPSGFSYSDRVARWLAEAQYLSGAELTPELLWQLAPWSWLVDWFFDLGTLFSSLTRFTFDGLVMRYGYMMVQKDTSWTHLGTNIQPEWYGTNEKPPFSTLLTTRIIQKERFKASPYGFGVDPLGFSDFQWSILAALGLSKSPRSLH